MAIGRTNTGGGGGGLNVTVKAYASADALPASASENAIAVITESEITSWIFSATEPESPSSGMVWFTVGTSSSVAFNAAKKNSVMLYPVLASQYISGSWQSMEAYAYQHSDWKQFSLSWDGYYFKDGNQYEDITGGWTTEGWNNYGTAKAGDVLSVSSSNASTCARIGTVNPVDLTGVNTIWLDSPNGKGSSAYPGYLLVCTEKADFTDVAQTTISAVGTASIDVSGLSGPHYLLLRTLGGASGHGSADIRAIWTE